MPCQWRDAAITLSDGLEAAALLVQALEIVSGRAVDEQDVGLRALGDEVEDTVIGGDAELEEGVVEPDLVFKRNEEALLVGGDGGGDGIERVEADVGVAGAIVEEAGVENVLGGDVELETEEIVARPIFPGVGA